MSRSFSDMQHRQFRESPKGTFQDGEPATSVDKNIERKHTSKAQSSRQRQEASNVHRSGGSKAAPSSPKCNSTSSVRLHPDTRERINKRTARTATTETPGKPTAPERQPGPTVRCSTCAELASPSRQASGSGRQENAGRSRRACIVYTTT